MLAEQLRQFFELCTSAPVFPASLLMLVIGAYGAMVLLGALDIDLFDFDVDVEGDAASSVGFVALKFLNIGEVPLMIWLSTLAFLWWVVSIILGSVVDGLPDPEASGAVWQVARNLAFSVLLTKAATQPLCKIFAKQAARSPEDLIGCDCEISTYEATSDAGQARFPTDSAPLLLNVRTRGETLKKGDTARIVDYDPAAKLYLVAAADPA